MIRLLHFSTKEKNQQQTINKSNYLAECIALRLACSETKHFKPFAHALIIALKLTPFECYCAGACHGNKPHGVSLKHGYANEKQTWSRRGAARLATRTIHTHAIIAVPQLIVLTWIATSTILYFRFYVKTISFLNFHGGFHLSLGTIKLRSCNGTMCAYRTAGRTRVQRRSPNTSAVCSHYFASMSWRYCSMRSLCFRKNLFGHPKSLWCIGKP